MAVKGSEGPTPRTPSPLRSSQVRNQQGRTVGSQWLLLQLLQQRPPRGWGRESSGQRCGSGARCPPVWTGFPAAGPGPTLPRGGVWTALSGAFIPAEHLLPRRSLQHGSGVLWLSWGALLGAWVTAEASS